MLRRHEARSLGSIVHAVHRYPAVLLQILVPQLQELRLGMPLLAACRCWASLWTARQGAS